MKQIIFYCLASISLVSTAFSAQKVKSRSKEESQAQNTYRPSVPAYTYIPAPQVAVAAAPAQQSVPAASQQTATVSQVQVQQVQNVATSTKEQETSSDNSHTIKIDNPLEVPLHTSFHDNSPTSHDREDSLKDQIKDSNKQLEQDRKQQAEVVRNIRTKQPRDSNFSHYVTSELTPLLQEVTPLYKDAAKKIDEMGDLLLLDHVLEQQKQQNQALVTDLSAHEIPAFHASEHALREHLKYLEHEDKKVKTETACTIIQELIKKQERIFLNSPEVKEFVSDNHLQQDFNNLHHKISEEFKSFEQLKEKQNDLEGRINSRLHWIKWWELPKKELARLAEENKHHLDEAEKVLKDDLKRKFVLENERGKEKNSGSSSSTPPSSGGSSGDNSPPESPRSSHDRIILNSMEMVPSVVSVMSSGGMAMSMMPITSLAGVAGAGLGSLGLTLAQMIRYYTHAFVTAVSDKAHGIIMQLRNKKLPLPDHATVGSDAVNKDLHALDEEASRLPDIAVPEDKTVQGTVPDIQKPRDKPQINQIAVNVEEPSEPTLEERARYILNLANANKFPDMVPIGVDPYSVDAALQIFSDENEAAIQAEHEKELAARKARKIEAERAARRDPSNRAFWRSEEEFQQHLENQRFNEKLDRLQNAGLDDEYKRLIEQRIARNINKRKLTEKELKAATEVPAEAGKKKPGATAEETPAEDQATPEVKPEGQAGEEEGKAREKKPVKTIKDLEDKAKPGDKTNGPTTNFEIPGGLDDAIKDVKDLGATGLTVHPDGVIVGTLPNGDTVVIREESDYAKAKGVKCTTVEIQKPDSRDRTKFRYL